jgi:hypothetical protein
VQVILLFPPLATLIRDLELDDFLTLHLVQKIGPVNQAISLTEKCGPMT